MKTALVLTAIILASACQSHKAVVVAKVGPYSITQKMVELRDALIKLDLPTEKKLYGLDQLTRAYTAAAILKNKGREINDQALRQEAARIQKSTLLPDRLAQIRKIFPDEESYLKVYVLPVLVDRSIYFDYFLHDPFVQKEPLTRAQNLIEAISSQGWKKAAANKTVVKFTISHEAGLVWEIPGQKKQTPDLTVRTQEESVVRTALDQKEKQSSNAEAESWIEEIVKTVKPGEIYKKPVDYGDSYLVVHFVKQSKGAYKFEAIGFAKEDFSKWLAAESHLVPIDRNP